MNTKLDPTDLAVVNGGMNTDGWRRSDNVEDRTGWTLEQSMNAPTPKVDPLPPLVRTPGDLSSQAGLDDIGRTFGGNDGGNFGF
ncbi:MAG TPA: hypothetical protein VFD36_25890 [Kofleriaceae bacterium]|jgi:hypothetical protein|nr:hypothetical protein [Kofleriaceae bacterium]